MKKAVYRVAKRRGTLIIYLLSLKRVQQSVMAYEDERIYKITVKREEERLEKN